MPIVHAEQALRLVEERVVAVVVHGASPFVRVILPSHAIDGPRGVRSPGRGTGRVTR
jgi:hypothetical protein